MKTKFIGIFAAAAFSLSGSAHASFHLYDIQEVFSNSDGSVLFVELFTTSSGQQNLASHTLRFEILAAIQNTLPLSTLATDSANKAILIGTANLSTLYGITPDFVIPAQFFTPGPNNFLNFAEGTDRVNLTLLPTNGTSSLNGLIADSGQTSASTSVNAQATPRNYAGQTVTIPEPSMASLCLIVFGFVATFRSRSR